MSDHSDNAPNPGLTGTGRRLTMDARTLTTTPDRTVAAGALTDAIASLSDPAVQETLRNIGTGVGVGTGVGIGIGVGKKAADSPVLTEVVKQHGETKRHRMTQETERMRIRAEHPDSQADS